MKKSTRKLINVTKKGMLVAPVAVYSWMDRFRKEERGDAAGWVFGVFISLLLLVGVYTLFKEQLNTFITTKIMGKMNTLE